MSTSNSPNTLREGPDENGHFGIFGGRYVAETLMPLVLDVEHAWKTAKSDPIFWSELEYYRKHYIGRPSPLYFASRLTDHFQGAKLYFKRDALGKGDSKLVSMLGLWLGPVGVALGIGIAYVIAAVFILFALKAKKIKRGSIIPFAPFLSCGGLLVWFFGNTYLIDLIYKLY